MKSIFILSLVASFLSCHVNEAEKVSSPSNSFSIYDSGDIVVGEWISTEQIHSGLLQYDLLLFQTNGKVKFAQGISEHQAIQLARKSSLKSNWRIIEDPGNNLTLADSIFLIETNIEGIGIDTLRVEVDFKNGHRMGRSQTDRDYYREENGLYTFGGKIFLKN
jgi:hypothetical protein